MDSWDPTVVTALFSLIGLVISASFGFLVSIVTGRRETQNAAKKAADEATEKAEKNKEDAFEAPTRLKDEERRVLTEHANRLMAEKRELAELYEAEKAKREALEEQLRKKGK